MTSRPGEGNVTVVFTPSGVHAEVAPGPSLLDAARAVMFAIDSTCGGAACAGAAR